MRIQKQEILFEQSNHTIAFLPAGRIQPALIPKRDIRKSRNKPCCSKETARQETQQMIDLSTTRETETQSERQTEHALERAGFPPEITAESKRNKTPPIKKLKESTKCEKGGR